jgi:hypothetical protein
VTGGMKRPPYQKDAGIAEPFGKAQAIYREIGKELNDVPLTGGGSDGNFTAALGIPTLDGLGADGKGAHAAYERADLFLLADAAHLSLRAAARDAGVTDVLYHAAGSRSLRALGRAKLYGRKGGEPVGIKPRPPMRLK